MPLDNTAEIIQESIEDVELPQEEVDAAIDEVEASGDTPAEAEARAEVDGDDNSGLTDTQKRLQAEEGKPELDEFAKKYGIPSQSASGRENRIPYSRVQKIVAKNTADLTKQLKDAHTAELQPMQAKLQEYDGIMARVGEFENIMVNDPDRFAEMLLKLPKWQGYQLVKAGAQAAEPPNQFQGMPEPNADGTYDLDGFKNALMWARQEAKREALEEFQKQISPLYQDWQAHQEYQRLLPQVEAQLNEARTWPGFTDSEGEILQALQSDNRLNLEGAYRKVVIPKLIDKAQNQRQAVIKDARKAPTSTAVSSGATRPGAQSSGPKSMEDIIRDSIAHLKR